MNAKIKRVYIPVKHNDFWDNRSFYKGKAFLLCVYHTPIL
jgi:hypothetical protein